MVINTPYWDAREIAPMIEHTLSMGQVPSSILGTAEPQHFQGLPVALDVDPIKSTLLIQTWTMC